MTFSYCSSTSFYNIHTIYNLYTTLLLIINYYASSIIQKTTSPFKTSKMTWRMATSRGHKGWLWYSAAGIWAGIPANPAALATTLSLCEMGT